MCNNNATYEIISSDGKNETTFACDEHVEILTADNETAYKISGNVPCCYIGDK